MVLGARIWVFESESLLLWTVKKKKISKSFPKSVRTPIAFYFYDVIGFLTTVETESAMSEEKSNHADTLVTE